MQGTTHQPAAGTIRRISRPTPAPRTTDVIAAEIAAALRHICDQADARR